MIIFPQGYHFFCIHSKVPVVSLKLYSRELRLKIMFCEHNFKDNLKSSLYTVIPLV